MADESPVPDDREPDDRESDDRQPDHREPGGGEPPGDEPPDPPGRAYPRRAVIVAVGLGGLAAVGWGLARVLGDDSPSTTDDQLAAPSEATSEAQDRRARREERRAARSADRERRRDRDRPATTEATEATDTTEASQPDAADHAAHEPATEVTKEARSPSGQTMRWSDQATWDGSLPGPTDLVSVDIPVLLDADVTVAGLRIGANGSLSFDPAASHRLSASGNVVVTGQLSMRPADATVVHELQFIGVEEARFQGGHSEAPLDSDVGLWVVAAGILDANGAQKTSWTNLASPTRSGERTITVDDAAGWRVGDEVVITPTEPTTVPDHWVHHDRRTITSISGQRIVLDRRLEFPHPNVTVRPGVVHRPEVLNLGRNVVIAGTPEGRAHLIFLQTTKPQQVSYVALHDMGPRQNDDEEVLGRYAVHFHNDLSGSRGSVLEGVVVRDSTGHAFAAHLSDGVTFRECIAHDLVDDAFWWDLSLDGGGRDLVPSNEIVYERCVAHFVKSGANSRFNLTGFLMGAGDGNIARGCVATGIQGGAESSAGFHWPSLSRDDNTWTFEGNLAHNNRHSGIYFWQNGKPRTLIESFTAYHCGEGIFAGAYANLVSYRNSTIYACEDAGLIISALPARDGKQSDETITYDGMYIDQAGLTDYAVLITKHLGRGGRVTTISNCTFKGGRVAQVGLPEGGDHPQLYDFNACTFDGNAFWLADDVPVETELRVSGPDGSYVVRRFDQPGNTQHEWNASVSPS